MNFRWSCSRGGERLGSATVFRSLIALVLASALAPGCAHHVAPAAAPPPARVAAAAPAPAPPPPLPEWRDAVLYFAIVDRWADGESSNDAGVNRAAKGTFHGGDLEGLRAHLDEIASLGVNAIWITPVVKNVPGFVTGAGFPDWAYHGYWPDDFASLDPRFGTDDDLKAFVDGCHARGIRVLLDTVYNHAGYNSHWLTDPATRNWFRTEDKGTCGQDDLTSCVAGLPDFRTELPEVADFVMNPQIERAKAAGVDGFRLDTVKHIDHPFWKVHRARTRAVRPDFFLLGEVWGGDAQSLDPWFAEDEMDAGFDFSFQGSTLGWVQGRGRTVSYDRYLKSREKVRSGHLLAHFLSSHDVPGALFQLKGDKDQFRLAALLQMTTAGIPVVYYGEEVGRIGGDWPDNRSDMPWGDRRILPGAGAARDESLRADYVKMIGIRRAHPALSHGTHVTMATEGDLLVFGRDDGAGGETVVVAVNRGSAPAEASVPLPARWAASPPPAVRDVWNGEDVVVENAAMKLRVGPRSARIVTLPAGAR